MRTKNKNYLIELNYSTIIKGKDIDDVYDKFLLEIEDAHLTTFVEEHTHIEQTLENDSNNIQK